MSTKYKTARENMLLIAAMSGGEIKRSICREICGSKAALDAITQKAAGELEVVYGNAPRTMRITRSGCERIEGLCPGITELFDRKEIRYRADQSTRHADISQTIYDMQLADVPCFPPDKVSFAIEDGWIAGDVSGYYAPREIRVISEEAMRHSRMCGALFLPDTVYVLYNIADRNIRFDRKSESKIRAAIKNRAPHRSVCSIVFGDGYDTLDMLCANEEYAKQMGKRLNELNRITPKDDMLYIPNGDAGVLCIRALYHQDLIEREARRVMRETGKETLSVIPMSLAMPGYIRASHSRIEVLCLPDQADYVMSLKNASPVEVDPGLIR